MTVPPRPTSRPGQENLISISQFSTSLNLRVQNGQTVSTELRGGNGLG